ncbi:MAG: PAS domain S-box protein [Phycisphaerales bacterium]|nr:MAG: PAS domain S-box protein [Phycisphaerales bacterium]
MSDAKKTRTQLLEEIRALRERVAEIEQEAAKRKQAEEALARERDLLHTLMDHIPDTIYFKDEQSCFTRINRAQAEILGTPDPSAAIGKTDFDFFELEHARSAYADEQEMLKSGRGVIGKGERMRRADGEYRWISTTKVPIRGKDGKYHGIVGISRDVTPQKRAEEQLKKSEERYRGLVESQQDLIGRVDRDGRITFVNEAYCRMFGKTREELIGQSFEPFVREDDRAAAWQAMRSLEDPPHRTSFEQRALTAHGLRWIDWEINAVRDEHGQTAEIQVVGRDITDRKRAEEALRESEQRLAAIAGNIPGAVYRAVYQADGQVVFPYISPGLGEMIGVEPAEVAADPQRALQWVHPDDRATVVRALAASVQTLHRVDMEYRLVTRTGDVKWVRDLARLQRRDDGNVIRDGVVLDVSQRKHMEQQTAALEEQLHQAQKMEALGQLAAGVAHDFSNLLTIVLGGAEQLRRKLGTAHAGQEALTLIEHAAEEARGVTRSLLSFSRRVPSEKRPLDLARFVDESSRFMRRILPASIELSVEAAFDDPLWVLADSSQLHLVILNLAINARDAMPDGGKLDVLVSGAPPMPMDGKGESARPAARLVVRDTGSGMSTEVARRVFEPFFTTKPRGAGTGLGLAIVLSIINEHEGTIEVESSPGAGATFTITLPCVPPDSKPEAAAPAVEPRGRGQAILLAEDNRYIRKIITSTLQSFNYRVVQAADGVSAMDLYREHQAEIRLLILDLDLPKRGGLDCLREIRESRVETPAILITAHAHVDLEDQIDENSYVLPKPFQMADIGQLVALLVTDTDSEDEAPVP